MRAMKRTEKESKGILQLSLQEPIPLRLANQLLIKVYASAVNRTDCLALETGQLPQGNPILGVEVAGEVVESNHPDFPVGKRVMGLVNGGGYAEYVCMNPANAMPLPENLSFIEGAAIPEVFLTAYQTLFWLGALQTNESVLIHAGGSGVGTAAIQLVKQLTQATIFVTAGQPKKLELCQRLGADELINYHDESFSQVILEKTKGKGVNLILDFIGASYWHQNITSIALEGRLILIGILGGAVVDQVNLMDIMRKRLKIEGTLLTPRSDAYKAALTKEFMTKTAPLFLEGTLRPLVDSIFPLDQAAQAQAYMEANKNTGKIILTP